MKRKAGITMHGKQTIFEVIDWAADAISFVEGQQRLI